MPTLYNYNATFVEFSVTVTFALVLTTVSGTPPTEITSLTGSISYTGTYTSTSNISLLAPGSFGGNDNILNSLSSPYFNFDGLSFSDNTNGINYNIFMLSGSEFVFNSQNGNSALFTSESLTIFCLLENTKILTPTGYKLISDIEIGDYITSENDRKIKVKRIFWTDVDFIPRFFPYKIPKGELNAFENLYLSRGHAVKIDTKFKTPIYLGYKKVTKKELNNIGLTRLRYYHIELECNENETRRTNTLIANGVIVESLGPPTHDTK